MKQTLRINLLDYVSVEKAILKMNEFLNATIDKTDKAMDKIAFGLRDEADKAYQAAVENEDNTNVSVEVEDKSGRYYLRKFVRASGPDLMFNEFGAGSATDMTHEWAQIAGDVYPGSWSYSRGTQELYKSIEKNGVDKSFWHHGGQRYYNRRPSRALLNATDHYRNGECQKVLDEEFK